MRIALVSEVAGTDRLDPAECQSDFIWHERTRDSRANGDLYAVRVEQADRVGRNGGHGIDASPGDIDIVRKRVIRHACGGSPQRARERARIDGEGWSCGAVGVGDPLVNVLLAR